MARTTDTDVRGIIEVDTSISLVPFIAVANALVTRACASAEDEDGNAYYSAEELELIERWLSAHFYATRDNRPTSEKAGSVSVNYSVTTGLGLANSMWGQTAMVLDANGGLAALSKQAEEGNNTKIGAWYIGTEPHESTRDLTLEE